METTIELETEFIPLSALLKLAGVAESGGFAKHLVVEGHVTVNGKPETRRGAKIRPGDDVVVRLPGHPDTTIHVA